MPVPMTQEQRAEAAQEVVDLLRSRGVSDTEAASILFDAGVTVLAEMSATENGMRNKLAAATHYVVACGLQSWRAKPKLEPEVAGRV